MRASKDSIENGSKCARTINGSSKSAEAVRVAPVDAGVHQPENPVWAQPRPSLRDAVYWALSLSVRLASGTFLVALVCLLPWLFYRVQQFELDVDFSKREPLLSLTEICRRREKGGVLGRIWCHDFEYGNFPVVMPVIMFPAVSFALIVKLDTIRKSILLGVQAAAYVVLMSFYLSQDERKAELPELIAQIAFILPTILLFLFLPRQSRVWMASIGLVAICALGLSLMNLYDMFRGVGDLVFLCVIWPMIREFFYFTARSTACFVAMSPRFGNGNVELRRHYAWILVLVVQVFLATWYRLIATKIQDGTRYTIFIVLSTLQEVAFRLTIREREKFFAIIVRLSLQRRCRRSEDVVKPRSAVIAPITHCWIPDDAQTRAFQFAETEWYALLALGEMISEYLALWLVLGLILLCYDSILTLPLPFFADLEDPFEQQVDVMLYFWLTLGQLLAEAATDCVCIVSEQLLHACPLHTVWQVIPLRVRLVSMTCATITGLSLALTLFFNSESGSATTVWCTSTNICSCMPPEASKYQWITSARKKKGK